MGPHRGMRGLCACSTTPVHSPGAAQNAPHSRALTSEMVWSSLSGMAGGGGGVASSGNPVSDTRRRFMPACLGCGAATAGAGGEAAGRFCPACRPLPRPCGGCCSLHACCRRLARVGCSAPLAAAPSLASNPAASGAVCTTGCGSMVTSRPGSSPGASSASSSSSSSHRRRRRRMRPPLRVLGRCASSSPSAASTSTAAASTAATQAVLTGGLPAGAVQASSARDATLCVPAW